MSDAEAACAECLVGGWDTPTLIGSELWGRKGRKPQCYARPAGAVLARMERKGLVRKVVTVEGDEHLLRWRLTPAGRAQLHDVHTSRT